MKIQPIKNTNEDVVGMVCTDTQKSKTGTLLSLKFATGCNIGRAIGPVPENHTVVENKEAIRKSSNVDDEISEGRPDV